MQVYVPPHPLIKHWLAIARNKDTPSAIFRNACAELGRILIYEAAREWLPTLDIPVDTPCGTADCTIVDPTRPVKVHGSTKCSSTLLQSTKPCVETWLVQLCVLSE